MAHCHHLAIVELLKYANGHVCAGHFVVDQFNAAGWPDSPGFGPGFSMAPGTSSDSDGVYYLD